MSNIVKVGKVNVNLDTLKGVSRFNVDKMFSHKSDAWRDALWSHIEMLTPSKEEEEPIKKKKKKTKNHTEE
jgi:hypothetical protein